MKTLIKFLEKMNPIQKVTCLGDGRERKEYSFHITLFKTSWSLLKKS